MACRIIDDDTFRRLTRARDFLAAGYAERVTLRPRCARSMSFAFHFQRLFTRTFGETPQDFLTRRRMDTAKQLLASGDLPVTKVCLEVGYQSMATFSHRFGSAISDQLSALHPADRGWLKAVVPFLLSRD